MWIGLASDVGEDGKVKFSYPSSYMNTLRGNWGYAAEKTSDYVFGSAALFERDDFGPGGDVRLHAIADHARGQQRGVQPHRRHAA